MAQIHQLIEWPTRIGTQWRSIDHVQYCRSEYWGKRKPRANQLCDTSRNFARTRRSQRQLAQPERTIAVDGSVQPRRWRCTRCLSHRKLRHASVQASAHVCPRRSIGRWKSNQQQRPHRVHSPGIRLQRKLLRVRNPDETHSMVCQRWRCDLAWGKHFRYQFGGLAKPQGGSPHFFQ